MDAGGCTAMFPDLLYFTFSGNNLPYVGSYRRPSMLVVLIVLLLLTALVATEPSSPGGGDS